MPLNNPSDMHDTPDTPDPLHSLSFILQCPMCLANYELVGTVQSLPPPVVMYWYMGRIQTFKEYTMGHCPSCGSTITLWSA